MSVELTTFSFPLRTVSASAERTPSLKSNRQKSNRLVGQTNQNLASIVKRFHGDQKNLLVRCWCDSQFMDGDQVAWPLFLYGPSGTGKSALAETLASRLIESNDDWNESSVRKLSGAEFRRQFLAAIATRSVASFRDHLYRGRLLLLDDIDLSSSDTAVLRELVQLLDFYERNQLPVIVTSGVAAWALTDASPDLKSRLSGGLSIPVQHPGLEAKREIVAELLQRMNLQVAAEDLDWLVKALPNTAPLIQQVLIRLAISTTTKSKSGDPNSAAPSIALSRVDMKPWLPAASALPVDDETIYELVKMVARRFQQRVGDLLGKSRRREVVRARSVAMYIARENMAATFQQIGTVLGNRDPSTVRHACKQIEEASQSDAVLKESIDWVNRQINKQKRNDSLKNEGP